jgi:putative transposase
MDAGFCVEALEEATSRHGAPDIFNTGHGVQFTSDAFTGVLKAASIRISMDGKGRWVDNVFVEWLWRSLIIPQGLRTVAEARLGISNYFRFYNCECWHQFQDWQTPGQVYGGSAMWQVEV